MTAPDAQEHSPLLKLLADPAEREALRKGVRFFWMWAGAAVLVSFAANVSAAVRGWLTTGGVAHMAIIEPALAATVPPAFLVLAIHGLSEAERLNRAGSRSAFMRSGVWVVILAAFVWSSHGILDWARALGVHDPWLQAAVLCVIDVSAVLATEQLVRASTLRAYLRLARKGKLDLDALLCDADRATAQKARKPRTRPAQTAHPSPAQVAQSARAEGAQTAHVHTAQETNSQVARGVQGSPAHSSGTEAAQNGQAASLEPAQDGAQTAQLAVTDAHRAAAQDLVTRAGLTRDPAQVAQVLAAQDAGMSGRALTAATGIHHSVRREVLAALDKAEESTVAVLARVG